MVLPLKSQLPPGLFVFAYWDERLELTRLPCEWQRVQGFEPSATHLFSVAALQTMCITHRFWFVSESELCNQFKVYLLKIMDNPFIHC
jgi:hypothetical protein